MARQQQDALKGRTGGMDAEHITQALRTAISTAELRPGQPLRQDHIAERFGVSHIPVREAFRQLSTDGLVTSLKNRGVAVSTLSAGEVSELTDLRCLLEVQMLEWAIPHLSPHDLDQAEALIGQIESAPGVGHIIQINGDFHRLLYVKASRPYILDVIERARVNMSRYLHLAWATLDHLPRSQAEHRHLIASCRTGDRAEVRSLLTRHIRKTGDVITAFLAGNTDAPGQG